MRLLHFFAGITAFSPFVSSQAASTTQVCDSTTSICFSTYISSGLSIGIAIPNNIAANTSYDAIISISAPSNTTWVGLAWGGSMTYNPLTVGWPYSGSAVVSSRWAVGFSLPSPYDGATYTPLKGTTSNSTHWTLVTKCTGCTTYPANDGSTAILNSSGVVPLAWAAGNTVPVTPSSNTSDFNIHQAYGKWNHDLSSAKIANFDSLVKKNVLPAATWSTSTVGPTSTSTSTSKTLTTITTKTSSAPTTTGTGKGKIPASCSGASAAKFSSVLASGWKATKVLGGLTSPRSMIFDLAGNMLIVQNGKGITVHSVDSTGCITSSKTLISLNTLNHGITLSADGKTLYASSMTQVFAYPYDSSTQTVGSSRTIVVQGMYNGGAHTTRTLLLNPKYPNLLIVSHGSNDNWDYAAGSSKTGRAIVKVFDLSAVPSGGYSYPSGGWVAGYGVRNEVGVVFDGDDKLWGVENSGDNFSRTPQSGGSSKDIHTDNPGEKLHYFGDISKAPTTPTWFGYPTCFAVWQPSAFSDAKFAVGDAFVVAPNSTFNDASCAKVVTPPSLVFQAHSAPIDSKFDLSFSNLFVTFHGSWNRQPTTGFKLVVVPFTKGSNGNYRPVADLSQSTNGYQDVMWNPDVTKCAGNGPSSSSGCFRPAGLVVDAQGRLYMTSDTSSEGEIWVLGKN